jgi:hypothetical protein
MGFHLYHALTHNQVSASSSANGWAGLNKLQYSAKGMAVASDRVIARDLVTGGSKNVDTRPLILKEFRKESQTSDSRRAGLASPPYGRS